ncbi:exodeoxyribonuclease V subunit gamma [methane-oxidizing endosymbiont of Gigantopelta aegis]|uniref:exodeoxyribonuclease V subunit gamma n=1 Tax=methane-oxidizing endosymbiont of Gigantopelta aegis TaxID=2794938 RepID=UPI0018DD52DC|nr:exodeoxyribonuclease V subunit gamma [methane-oxidizing endosymbiont of Gigantopelta aegis]
MFFLHSANNTESLLAHLSTVFRAQPLDSFFDRECFLIQSLGMERMLSQYLAQEFSTWSHFEFLFPANFFATLTRLLAPSPSTDYFDRTILTWRIESLLRTVDDPVYTPLQIYLQPPNLHLKRFQLARSLAALFDQYQIMRPDMLEAWQNGETFYHSAHEPWQRALWQEICAIQGSHHRGALWLQLIEMLNSTPIDQLHGKLPKRISIFGIHSLPPLFLECLQALSRHCDIHLYLLSPTQSYWADLPGKSQRAEQESLQDAHPLLATLGQQGREFQQLILEQLQFDSDFESFAEHNAETLLQQLQNDILNNTPSIAPERQDDSISIHSCHSRLRETEVIKDQILAELENDNSLNLRDIVVMAPDIQLYEPFINAVFNDIQHSIADRNLRLSNPILDTLLQFLHLCQSRFGWQEVLDLLEQPGVYPRFGLNEADLDRIRHWIADTRTRWGQSGQHKSTLGLPPLEQNTWQHTLDRLLMGYASSDSDQFIDDTLPYPHIEGLSAETLGGLNDFLQFLFHASTDLQTDMPLADWQQRLLEYTALLTDENLTQERLQLHELLLQLAHFAEIHSHPVSLNVIIHWLETTLSEQKTAQGFLRGHLTFCSMLPMRAIPFKIIVLLGMNDGEFPAQDRTPAFDLLANNYRIGDRSRRHDDRYQFLETLLSARKKLIISYIGQSLQHNDDIPPSVIISELIDVLQKDYQIAEPVTKHPLQAFSPSYFDNSHPQLFSFDSRHCNTAIQLLHANNDHQPWWQGEVDTLSSHTIEISDLMAFFRHPQKYFLQRQLDLHIAEIEKATEEREPFALEPLDRYSIKQEWLDCLLNQKPFSIKKLQAEGRWPQGSPGEIQFQHMQPAIQTFAEQILQLKLGEAIPAQMLDFQYDDYRIVGKLDNLYTHGSLIYRLSSLKGKDFMQAWLHHLLINQVSPQATYLLSEDHTLCFKPETDNSALAQLLKLYNQGQSRPDVFFTEAAFCYLQQSIKSKAKISPLAYSIKTLSDNLQYEPELRQLYPDQQALETVLNQDFANLCESLLLPTWKHSHDI